MRLLPLPSGALRLRLDRDEAEVLEQLIGQLIELLQSHSGTSLDPDPLFASLEIGGTESLPDDPALARLFPNAFEADTDAAAFRRVTEQGLVNRKLQDAIDVTSELGLSSRVTEHDATVETDITKTSMPVWVRTLTALRLAIAARIGLKKDEDHVRLLGEDETRSTIMVYDWLGAILDSILRMTAD